MPEVRVFSRGGCHLCEVLIEDLMPLIRGVARLEVCDVDSRPEWRDNYGDRVPVVEIEGHFVCRYRLDRDAVLARLREGPSEGRD